MQKFVSNQVEIEATQWDGTLHRAEEIIQWIKRFGGEAHYTSFPISSLLSIVTLEGVMDAHPGYWIIKGTINEFYPCKDEVFKVKYRQIASEVAPELSADVARLVFCAFYAVDETNISDDDLVIKVVRKLEYDRWIYNDGKLWIARMSGRILF